MNVEHVDFVSVLTQDLPRAEDGEHRLAAAELHVRLPLGRRLARSPDGSALTLRRRFGA